jgi:hypothetical protein
MVINERNYLSDAIKCEFSPDYCREVGTLITGQNLKGLTLLGKITATKKLTQLNPSATDGSETVAGILIDDTDATNADQKCVFIANGPILLAFSFIVLPVGATTEQIAIAKEQLWSQLRIKCVLEA